MSLLLFLLVLSVLVLIHEAGHYLAARLFGVKASEFGYGFPPRLIGFVKDRGRWKRIGRKDDGTYPGTIWSINWLPLGGFVRIKGEQAGEEDGKDSFHHKPIWKRVIILAAGVGMNWILATILFFVVFVAGANTILEDLPPGAVVERQSVTVTQVLTGSPADKAGILPNDVIVSVEGQTPSTYTDAQKMIAAKGEQPVSIIVRRGTEELLLTATPVYIQEAQKIALGVGIADVGRVRLPVAQALKASVLTTYGYTKAILFSFGGMVRDLVTFRGVSQDVSGPVGIAVMTGQIAQQGVVPLLQFAAVLSINLAVINFLPIPALDGGRVLFLVIEKLRRRAMSRNLEAAIHNIAFLVLIGLILLVTVRDVSKFGGVILDGAKGLVGM
jgi:regulator of sigma E protease